MRDVDGELAVAADEFLGAVERIDKQEGMSDGGSFPVDPASSATTGTPGMAAASASPMACSEPRSASLTGVSSTLCATEKSVP